MNRLYKFFALLFFIFLLVSFVYATIASYTCDEVLTSPLMKMLNLGDHSFGAHVKQGFLVGLIYALVLLLMVIFLFNKAFQNGEKFTVKNIISVAGWFFLATTIVYGIHYFTSGMYDGAPHPLWLPFLLAWGLLFILFMDRIKKTT